MSSKVKSNELLYLYDRAWDKMWDAVRGPSRDQVSAALKNELVHDIFMQMHFDQQAVLSSPVHQKLWADSQS